MSFRKKDFHRERIVDSTDNNEYAENLNDENFWEQDIYDTQIPEDDRLSDMANEDGIEDGPNYSDLGYKNIVP